MDVALSQEPPLTELTQFKAWEQSPDVLIVTLCPAAFACPAVPCKARVDSPETEQGIGVTVNCTLTSFEPRLLVTVTVPL